MTDEEILNKAKETSDGNYLYEQGFVYGFELGEENGRKEQEKENKICEEIIIGEQQEINRLEKENEQLKKEIKQIIEREHVVPEHYLCELIEKCKELKAQIEKMRCCSNCKHNYSCYYESIAELARMDCGKDLKSWELME